MNCRPPFHYRPAPGRRLSRLLLAGLSLLAGLTPPLTADVIDDFSNGRKFIMHGLEANPDWQLTDGQLVVNQPSVGTYSAFYYLRNYELRERQPAEFRVDLVSLAPGDGYAGLYVAFSGAPFLPRSPDRGYILYRQHHRFVLDRIWDGAESWYFDIPAPSLSQPETMSLILTREGTSLRVQARVALRDEAGTVLLLRESRIATHLGHRSRRC